MAIRMIDIPIPYGKSSLHCEIPASSLNAVLYSGAHNYRAEMTGTMLVRKALANPFSSPRLRELARDKRHIVVITSDHTRPVPSHITIPIILEEIRKDNPDAKITLLVATGMHRSMNREEIVARFGEAVSTYEKIVIHDCHDRKNLIPLGKLPSGGDLVLNRLVSQCDLLVSEGFIEPHFFAGFSGGRKAILPGIAGYETILANHCAEFITHDRARTGILDGNPIHHDMIYAAKAARLAFILNVVLGAEKNIIAAFAGDMDVAHRHGCGFLERLARVKAIKSDIVITGNGGYPLDQNMYQTVKCMTAAEAAVNEGGIIIAVSECSDGHGGEVFYNMFSDTYSPEEAMRSICGRKRNETLIDQWQIQIFLRVFLKHKIVMVTSVSREMTRHLGMIPAENIGEALDIAKRMLKNDDASVTVIPDGVSVIVE
jgi:nickel-dependent lactate racemase